MTYYADNLLKRKLKEKKIIKQMQEKFIKSARADSIRVDMVIRSYLKIRVSKIIGCRTENSQMR